MFFELENVKRRHSLYWDVHNEGWTKAPDSTMSWNIKRGIMIGTTASLIQESLTAFLENYKLLLTKYENPTSLK